jgi:hypothetical protein
MVNCQESVFKGVLGIEIEKPLTPLTPPTTLKPDERAATYTIAAASPGRNTPEE